MLLLEESFRRFFLDLEDRTSSPCSVLSFRPNQKRFNCVGEDTEDDVDVDVGWRMLWLGAVREYS